MCAVGDIIVIEKYLDHGNLLGRHSFVVIEMEKVDILKQISFITLKK